MEELSENSLSMRRNIKLKVRMAEKLLAIWGKKRKRKIVVYNSESLNRRGKYDMISRKHENTFECHSNKLMWKQSMWF